MAVHRKSLGRRRVFLLLACTLALGLAIAEAAIAEPAAGDAVEPAAPVAASESALGPFRLTPEQSETLRIAREAELRALLGLAADAPLPSAEDLTDAQRETLRAAREAEMRRVLGLGPDDPIPTPQSATAEHRRAIAAAHEARVRAALGLGPDEPLFRELPAAPAEGAPAALAPTDATDPNATPAAAPAATPAQGAPQ